MTSAGGRRYTDREVALVLKRAAELEERRDVVSPGGGGLTLAQLEEIAREVGLDPGLVHEAARELDHRRGPRESGILGPPASRKAVRAVAGPLDQEGMRALIAVVDGELPAEGIVTEALGTVRWTANDRFRSTQVTLVPADDETRIQVSQRYNGRVPLVLHLIPALWGGIGGVGFAAGLGLAGGAVAGIVAFGALLGAGAGRLVWHALSSWSERRVQRLAEGLEAEAQHLAVSEPPE